MFMKPFVESWKLFSQYSKERFFGRIYFCDWLIPEKSAEFIFANGSYEKTLGTNIGTNMNNFRYCQMSKWSY